MSYLDFEIDYEKTEQIQMEDALKNEEFVNNINYLVDEGFIELEESSDGEVRAFPLIG